MNKPLKKLSVLLTATALAVSLTGCSAADAARLERLCRESGIANCDLFFGGTKPGPVEEIKAVRVDLAQAPAALKHWVESQRMADASSSYVATEGDYTYVAIAAGMKPTGGYRVDVAKVAKQEGGWLVEAKVVAPAPGSIVTTALTNPVGIFQMPKLEGKVTVKLNGAEIPLEKGIMADDEVHSANFRVVRPRLAADDRILLEGKARAFEAMFKVEVWSGGQKIAEKAVQASEGGPAYGWFSTEIEIKGGVPADAEVHYIIVSMKDGSQTVELALPVAR